MRVQTSLWAVVAVCVLGLAAVSAGGCYKPSPAECALQCTAASGCPAGLTCANNFCVEPGSSTVCGQDPDADVDVDADVDAPTDAPPATRRYRALAVGSHHACAIDTTGQLWCWGANDLRQLGVALVEDFAATPQHVAPAMTDGEWREVSAGGGHTCALWAPTTGDPQLWCWGQNYSYQTGTTTGSLTAPHQVATPANQLWRSVAAGTQHTCAVLQSTSSAQQVIMCFGDNGRGQLASSGGQRATPMPVDTTGVPATTMWRSLSAGTDHTCAIHEDSRIYCWGDNRAGESGVALGGMSAVARPIQGSDVYGTVAAGDSFTCGIDSVTHVLRCWGKNGAGEMGSGQHPDTGTPTPVVDAGSSPKWKAISLGQYGGCGIQGPSASVDMLGTVRCWGANDFGERGDGTFGLATSGPSAGALGNAFAVGAGHLWACALAGQGGAAGGELRCWGDNGDGQVGNGNASEHRRPLRIGEDVRAGRSWTAVAAGRSHTCAILAGATVAQNQLYCWGLAASGQLDATAVGLPRRAPVRALAGDAATHVVVGSSHTCVRRDSGITEVKCWGSDQGQQLGTAGIQEPGPVTVFGNGSPYFAVGLLGVGNVTCATNPAGLRCWGSPEITTSYYIDSDTPFELLLNAGAFPNSSFTMGSSSGCWIEGAQTLCFGINSFGQLGWGMTSTPTTQPQPVMSLTDATSLSVGPGNHRCAITGGRVVKCWGANGYNQAGVNDSMDKVAPVTVQSPNQYDRVATGLNHTCALDGGAIFCWGNNDQFQRTATASTSSLPPSAIVGPLGESMPTFTQVVAGEFHTCAISSTGTLYCWGASRWGQVGAGTASEASPVQVLDGMP